MAKTNLLNLNGEKIKDIKLNETIFDIEPNDKVLNDAIILARASLRQGTHNTKTRDEVRGGGRKPWRQKGTGRARQGSIRAVQWRGGGIAFGPKPRDYSLKMNQKERRLALKSALAYKANENNILVLDNIALTSSKTKDVIKIFENLKLIDKKSLIVVKELEESLILATRNLGNIIVMEPNELNVLDIVAADVLIITEDALKIIEEVL
jgi:large subunit ribosomal protein L4